MTARSLHALPHNYATNSHGLEHHRVPVVSECRLDRARHVATQQPGLKPGELYHLGGPALFVVCSLHLPKIIEFYLHIQMLPAKLLLASLYVDHPVITHICTQCRNQRESRTHYLLTNLLRTRSPQGSGS